MSKQPLRPEFAASSFLASIIIERNPAFAKVPILIKSLYLILKADITEVKENKPVSSYGMSI
jgi:hypothetical protein